MFSQASVILSTGEGVHGREANSLLFIYGRFYLFVAGEACMAGVGACVAGETATAADGTHPTGMHSCINGLFTHNEIQSATDIQPVIV